MFHDHGVVICSFSLVRIVEMMVETWTKGPAEGIGEKVNDPPDCEYATALFAREPVRL